MRGILALAGAALTLGVVGVAGGEVNAVTPSTNDDNRSLGWAHVNVTTGPGMADLQFVSTRAFYSCFEYRTDGDTSQMIGEDNFNTNIHDGLYPYKCEFDTTETISVDARKYVEVRMVFGAETDERFDWTRFDVGGAANVVYSSIVANGPPSNLPSVGAEAYAYDEFGNRIAFAENAPRQLTNVTVTLSSWACVEGAWYTGDCVTPNGSTFDLPMTLTLYEVGTGGTLGDVLAVTSETFSVPYRPSASDKCDGGRWWSAGLKTCFNGIATDVTFNFGDQEVTLPDEVIYGITYNTAHYGYDPTGVSGPYDSLNIALNTTTSVGANPDGDILWRAAGGPFGPTWDLGGYVPAVQFKAGGGS